jgi:phosphatidylglycerol:prolipoprotein diacylglycerol transferase
MLPYFPQPVIAMGEWNIHAFSVTMASAIVVGRGIVLRRARRFTIGRDAMVVLYLCVLLAGIAGATAGLLSPSGGTLTSFGGAIAGLAAAILFCRWRRYSYVRMLWMFDVLAFAGTFAAALGRLGCALTHDHPGVPSTGWLAVRFPGGPRYDLGLLDFLFLVALCAAFCWLDRRPRPAGFFLFTGMIAYGAFRILRAPLELEPHVIEWALVCLAGIAAALIPPEREAKMTLSTIPLASSHRQTTPHRSAPAPATAPGTPPWRD